MRSSVRNIASVFALNEQPKAVRTADMWAFVTVSLVALVTSHFLQLGRRLGNPLGGGGGAGAHTPAPYRIWDSTKLRISSAQVGALSPLEVAQYGYRAARALCVLPATDLTW